MLYAYDAKRRVLQRYGIYSMNVRTPGKYATCMSGSKPTANNTYALRSVSVLQTRDELFSLTRLL